MYMEVYKPTKNLSKSELPRGVGYRKLSNTYYSTCYIKKRWETYNNQTFRI